jgi:hypothetical protein
MVVVSLCCEVVRYSRMNRHNPTPVLGVRRFIGFFNLKTGGYVRSRGRSDFLRKSGRFSVLQQRWFVVSPRQKAFFRLNGATSNLMALIGWANNVRQGGLQWDAKV